MTREDRQPHHELHQHEQLVHQLSLVDPDHLMASDLDFLHRLERLARRRTVTRAARDQAIAQLLAQTTAEDALADVGLDLDELRREL